MIKNILKTDQKVFDDKILIENPFWEITKTGTFIRYVELGLASNNFIIGTEHDRIKVSPKSSINFDTKEQEKVQIKIFLLPWHCVKLSISKRDPRDCLKLVYHKGVARYFELKDMPKRKIYWDLWKLFVMELNSSTQLWPFTLSKFNTIYAEPISVKYLSDKKFRQYWYDKYLYLGSKREQEDKIRPIPIPGLGLPGDLTLLQLKPRYFGCWDQSEHWVQCGNCSSEIVGQNK